LAGARSRLETARSALALLEERRSRSELRAPFSGRLVGDRPALGTWIAPGEPLCTVLDLDTLRLRVQVPEQDLPGLVAGETVASVTLPSLPGLSAAGRVTSIGAVADPETRSIPVRIEFESRDLAGPESGAARLVEGQFARATLEIERLRDVLTLRRNEVTDRGGVATVYVIESVQLEGADGLARAVGVRLGRETASGSGRIVLSGLLAGTRIATSRLDALRDGEPVLLESPSKGPGDESRDER
ncbi:MAG: efflux RND transporter periplasmic adaptor subunit, partial [Planctomycetota bacterium]